MTNDAETTATFRPKFDEKGLVTAVVTDCDSGALLMVAHMNAAAIAASQATGMAHFWSRSRGALWKKGETSGNILKICEMRVDCDQDCLWLIVEPAGPACHTGAVSCFYRKVNSDASLDAASGANPDSTS
ncbi:MAG: phosphoribosyl-AMP cyclohydrolase [Sphingopyxis sp.]